MGILKDLYIKYGVGAATAGAYNANRCQLFEQKAEWLRYFTLNSITSGVTDDRICAEEIVVTLTTYGRRLYDVYLAIESIMQGSLKPNRIILWLDEGLKEMTLPITLQKQMKRGLQIEFTEDIRSYKKLIPTLVKYPDAICVTIDDDLIYCFDLLENLINSYQKEPQYVHANRVHSVKLNENGSLKPYNSWGFCKGVEFPCKFNFATGSGGVIYPPHCFDKEVLNKNAFMTLAPRADDVWFYAMALLNGYVVKKSFTRNESGEEYILNENVQTEALNHANVAGGGNDSQIKAVFERYRIYDILKKK